MTRRYGQVAGYIDKTFKKNPTKLYTVADLINDEYNEKALITALWRQHKNGKIMRHKEKSEDGKYRYALEIADENAVEYVEKSPLAGKAQKGGTKKRGQKHTAKEIRTMFAQTMNQLAKLEDMVSDIVELAEDTDKTMQKIENLLGK